MIAKRQAFADEGSDDPRQETGAVGAATAIAGALLLAAMVIPGDPLGRLRAAA